jgi:hypothetical protein
MEREKLALRIGKTGRGGDAEGREGTVSAFCIKELQRQPTCALRATFAQSLTSFRAVPVCRCAARLRIVTGIAHPRRTNEVLARSSDAFALPL